ncbi:MAG: hypothetical protein V8S95_03530 [Odoribacter sp.]
MRLGDNLSVNVDAISTGSCLLTWRSVSAASQKGRIIEIYGPESSGKPRSPCTSSPPLKRRAAKWLLLTLNTRLNRLTPGPWGLTLRAC